VLSLSLRTYPLRLWSRPAERHHDIMIFFLSIVICRNHGRWCGGTHVVMPDRPPGLLQGAMAGV
jgi:hypothetical protein